MRTRRRGALAAVLVAAGVLSASAPPGAGGTAGPARFPLASGSGHVAGDAAGGAARTGPGRAARTRPGGPAVRPNFVFVLTDDLDGDSVRHMPNLQRLLVRRGVSFERYYVSLPWCCPSRATTLRGQYAHNTGVWTVSPPRGGFAAFHGAGLERSTIATWLHDAGYRTGMFGKYLNGYHNGYPYGPKDPAYIPPGWDRWAVPAAGSPYHAFDYTLNSDGRLERHRPQQRDYLTDVLSQRAGEFVAARDRRPFFAYIAPYSPHLPATPAPRHAERYGTARAPRTPSFDAPDMAGKPAALRRLPRVTAAERAEWDELYRNRLRSLRAVDDMIGDLVGELTRSGRLASTYLIFTSDNGFHIGQHRMAPGKNTPYEEDVRVPFLVTGPGVRAGGRVGALAGNVDVAPTLADLAGVPAPAFVDGRSLAPLLRRPEHPGQPGRAAQASGGTRTAYLLEQGKIPGAPAKPRQRKDAYLPPFTAIRTTRYLYVEYATGERELYDVAKDPFQLRNIAAGNPIIPRLAARLSLLRSCAGESCRAIEAEP